MKISVKQLREMISEAITQATDAKSVTPTTTTTAAVAAPPAQSGRTSQDLARAIDRLYQSITNVANRTTQKEAELEQRIARLEQALSQRTV
jgi:hypothetical protein